MSSTASLIRNPDSGYFAKTLSKERSAAIVLSGNGNDSDDEEVSTPSKTPKAPKSMARGENKSEARPPSLTTKTQRTLASPRPRERLLDTTSRRLTHSDLLQRESQSPLSPRNLRRKMALAVPTTTTSTMSRFLYFARFLQAIS